MKLRKKMKLTTLISAALLSACFMNETSMCMYDEINLEDYREYLKKRKIIEQMQQEEREQQAQTPEQVKNNQNNKLIQPIEGEIIQQSSQSDIEDSNTEQSDIEKSYDLQSYRKRHCNSQNNQNSQNQIIIKEAEQKMDPYDILAEYRKNMEIQRKKQQEYENSQNQKSLSTQCMTIIIMVIMIVKMFIDLRIISA